MTLEQFKKISKKMPDAPGVYFFLGKNKKVLYIGKATSLRDRVRSYFAKDLAVTRGPLITAMLEGARSLDWRQTDSVLEALILEANLIKNYKPKHNTDLKDDKSWNYVVVTKEDFPRVLLMRGKELNNQQLHRATLQKREKSFTKDFSYSGAVAPTYISSGFSATPLYIFGPFPHGLQLREALKLIRKIFPYRDKCMPPSADSEQGETLLTRARFRLAQKHHRKLKRCFNAQLGLCPGVCSGAISKTEYRKIIRNISLLFQGKKKTLVAMLKREMRAAAKAERFEEATRARKQIFALEHIRDISLIKDEVKGDALRLGAKGVALGLRIEAYDAAHLQGSAAVGVMTVVEGGEAAHSEYRKFRLRATTPGDDTGALKEMLSRRLGHDEWPMPKLIVVDGSTAQINAAEGLLRTYGVAVPVVGVVKDEKHRPRDIRGDRTLVKGREREILLANAEAHRFAIGYHRKTSRKSLRF